MGWYALIGLLAIVILVIENHDILLRDGDRQLFPDFVGYRKFLFGIMAYYITDTLWGVLDSLHLTALLYADTVVYYVAMAVGVLLWTRYVVSYLGEENIYGRLLLHAGNFFFGAVVLITIINCFTPVLFWFDENGTYHACPARHAQLIFQIVLLLLTSTYTFRAMRRTKENIRKRYHTIFLFGMAVALLLTVQLKYPFLPLYTIGYMLGTSLLHTFVVGNEIDEYKRIKRQSEVAIAANKAKTTFLANMSHEIRTPINAVLGMNEMILREAEDDTQEAFRSRAERERYHESFTAPSARVLVVDDNPMNLAVFGSLIKKTLVRIDSAESGDEGLALTQKNDYDMIFLDHMMPDKDGIETLRELKAQDENPNRDIPVICLTANAISGAKEEYLEAGFDDYLTKPINAVKLENMMRRFLPQDKILLCADTEAAENAAESEQVIADELGELKDTAIDVECGIRNSGTVDAYLPLLRMFYQAMEDKEAELNSLFGAEDYPNYTIKVHALKSSLRIIGAVSLGEIAQALEDAGKREDVEYIRKNHEAFMRDISSLKEPLSRMFASNEEDDTDKPEADRDLMKEVFSELVRAADDMNMDDIEGIIKDMEGYRIPGNLKELYETIRNLSENYDYDEILALARKGCDIVSQRDLSP